MESIISLFTVGNDVDNDWVIIEPDADQEKTSICPGVSITNKLFIIII